MFWNSTWYSKLYGIVTLVLLENEIHYILYFPRISRFFFFSLSEEEYPIYAIWKWDPHTPNDVLGALPFSRSLVHTIGQKGKESKQGQIVFRLHFNHLLTSSGRLLDLSPSSHKTDLPRLKLRKTTKLRGGRECDCANEGLLFLPRAKSFFQVLCFGLFVKAQRKRRAERERTT